MDLLEVINEMDKEPMPLEKFDKRIGGTKKIAKKEFLALCEFGTSLRLCRYKYLTLEHCWDVIKRDSIIQVDKARKIPGIPIFEENKMSNILWYEFESLVYIYASTSDRLGKIIGWTYSGITNGRLDKNILKLPQDSHLFWLLHKHISWASYLADLRNTGLHRVILLLWARLVFNEDGIKVPLPDHANVKSKESDDPSLFTYNENRNMMETSQAWYNGLLEVTNLVFDDYFSKRNR